MGMRSKRKGAVAELELAKLLCAAGFSAHRGRQYHGGPDSPDIRCSALPSIHFESKRAERINIYDALDQAMRDKGAEQIAVVAHRRNHSQWLAVLRLADLLEILRRSDLVEQPDFKVEDALNMMGGAIMEIEP